MTARTKVPKFKSEAQERSFWEARDSAELVDWSKAKRVRLAQSEAIDPEYFAAASGAHARTYQGRRQCSRRSLSVADQGLARGKAFGVTREA